MDQLLSTSQQYVVCLKPRQSHVCHIHLLFLLKLWDDSPIPEIQGPNSQGKNKLSDPGQWPWQISVIYQKYNDDGLWSVPFWHDRDVTTTCCYIMHMCLYASCGKNSWKWPSGRTRNNWLDKIYSNNNLPPADLWCAICQDYSRVMKAATVPADYEILWWW